MRVLIVDDEPLERELLRLTLHEAAPEITVAGECGDGRQALLIAQTSRPDVAFIDVRLPLMDGLTLGRQLRQSLPDVKIVIISAYDEFSYAQRAIDIGTVAYLLKPIDRAGLETVLYKLTDQPPRGTTDLLHGASETSQALEPEAKMNSVLTVEDPLLRVLQYIRDHIAHPLPLNLLADYAGFHPSALSRAFKRKFGVRISDYIARQRIEHAELLLLRYPTMPIQEVSDAAGFSSPHYFNAVFQESLHCSPTEFRNRNVNRP